MPDPDFASETARLSDILSAINLLSWDARTQMPPGGNEARARQIATLTGIARDCATGPRMRDALAAAAEGATDPDERALVGVFADRVETLRRIPHDLVVEMAALRTTCHAAWIAARDANDFSVVQPSFERIFALQRTTADAIGYDDHPYDALAGQYEDGMTIARLRPLFATLRAGIAPLLDALRGVAFGTLPGPVPIDAQKRVAREFAFLLGFDFARGRLDETVHPFEIPIARDDVRITSRFHADRPGGGLFASLHEAGHGIYEQNVSPRWSRGAGSIDVLNLYAVGGRTFGLHEAQSRLYENRVGRSRRFAELHVGRLRDAFGPAFAGLDAAAFWRAVNAPRPGLVRVEADELTYDAHIMLRVELEAATVAGDIKVADLPGIWNERVGEDLGLDVPDLAHGVLQDVHWSAGYVGSFPTYTLGNVMASQLFATACRDHDVAAGLDTGDYRPLGGWLASHVHRHGRSRDRERILREATGQDLDPAPYLADLAGKAAALIATAA